MDLRLLCGSQDVPASGMTSAKMNPERGHDGLHPRADGCCNQGRKAFAVWVGICILCKSSTGRTVWQEASGVMQRWTRAGERRDALVQRSDLRLLVAKLDACKVESAFQVVSLRLLLCRAKRPHVGCLGTVRARRKVAHICASHRHCLWAT